MQSKQLLQQSEAAIGAERQKLMSNHLSMKQKILRKMQTMKPKAGMHMKEHEDWINEHQKLLDGMMGQMMSEQRMLMDMGNNRMSTAQIQRMKMNIGLVTMRLQSENIYSK